MTPQQKLHYIITKDLSPISQYPGYFANRNGEIYSNKQGQIKKLTPAKMKLGYRRLQMFNNGVKTRESVHRLVAYTFIPNPDNKPQINHINGIKHDNRVENLEWCTRSENWQHAYRTGLIKTGFNRGEKHPNSKLTQSQVLEIRNLKGIITQPKIAERYNICVGTVAMIWSRKLWGWLE